ncbi:MAG: hypothetical protein H6701_14450 [Myxococcales bacterium]|nr:hypothetical protein [Myxococcales bacterium]MCB9553970.1 hypothetical protein [Myxococcales bacterium]
MVTPSPAPDGGRSPSMAFLYFVFGFTLAAAISMLLLIVLRPMLMADSPPAVLRLAMFTPVVLGAVYGGRVAWFGMRRGLGLGAALKTALVPWQWG